MTSSSTPQSFGLLSSRHVTPPASAIVLTSLCPLMDLLAVITKDSTLHIHRLNWERIVKCDLKKSCGIIADPEQCPISSLCWRPDGRAIAIGFHTGLVALFEIETRMIVKKWVHSSSATKTQSSITTLQWISYPHTSAATSRLIKHAYLTSLYDEFERLPPSSSDSLEDSSTSDRVLAPLQSVESMIETWTNITGGASTGASTKSHQPHQHGGVRASASTTTSVSTDLLGVLYDSSSSSLNLLLIGSSTGEIAIRACGTLEVARWNVADGVVAMMMCPASGVLSVVTRSASVSLHLHSLPRLFLTHPSSLLHLTTHTQHISGLLLYVEHLIKEMKEKWKVARKSWTNRIAALEDVKGELKEEAANSGMIVAEEEEESSSTLLTHLLTGLPTPLTHAFITRYLSASSLQKSCDLIQTSLIECQAIVAMGMKDVAEKGTVWCQEVRREVEGMKDEEDDGDNSNTSILSLAHLQTLSTSFHTLLLFTTRASNTISSLRSTYQSFSYWLLSQVRILNNEHDQHVLAAAQAQAAEEHDGADPASVASVVPEYGPYDIEGIEMFLKEELEEDTMEKILTLGGNEEDEKMISPVANDKFFPEFITAALPSSSSSSTSFTTLLTQLNISLTSLMTSAVVISPHSEVKETMCQLFGIDNTTQVAASGDRSGMMSTVSLTHHTHTDGKKNDHLLAFSWTKQEDASQQYVSVVKYFNVDCSTTNDDRQGDIQKQWKYLTILVPSISAVDDVSSSSARITSVSFYTPDQLAVLVQYRSESTKDDAASTQQQVSSKLWLISLKDEEISDKWKEVDQSMIKEQQSFVQHVISLENDSDDSPIISLHSLTSSIRSRLFPNTVLNQVQLNSIRSLAAVVIGSRKASEMEENKMADEEESKQQSQSSSLTTLMHAHTQNTRRVILIDIDDDDEADEPVEDATTEGEAAGTEQMTDADDAKHDDTITDPSALHISPSYELIEENEDVLMIGDLPSHSTSNSKPGSTRSSFGVGGGGGGSKRSSGVFANITSSSTLLMSPLHLTLILSLLLLFLSPASASWGDIDPRYRTCLDICHSRCSMLQTKVESQNHPPHSDPFDVLRYHELIPWKWGRPPTEQDDSGPEHPASPQRLTWLEKKVFGWNCESDCKYQCMHRNHLLRLQRGEQVVKYYGKWPFLRVYGMQELFSSLFSLVNALPHLYWLFFQRKRFAHEQFPMKSLWNMYALININTWIWSTVFHARDFIWTERADYFCASLGISFSVCIALIYLFKIHTWVKRICFVFLPMSILLLCHISYLQFIHFDYGWNMKVSLTIGIIHSLLWLVYCYIHWNEGYHHRLIYVTLGLWCFASLEVYDFPPYFDLLDAHSIWHGLTPILGVLFYKWLKDDCEYKIRVEKQLRSKMIPARGAGGGSGETTPMLPTTTTMRDRELQLRDTKMNFEYA